MASTTGPVTIELSAAAAGSNKRDAVSQPKRKPAGRALQWRQHEHVHSNSPQSEATLSDEDKGELPRVWGATASFSMSDDEADTLAGSPRVSSHVSSVEQRASRPRRRRTTAYTSDQCDAVSCFCPCIRGCCGGKCKSCCISCLGIVCCVRTGDIPGAAAGGGPPDDIDGDAAVDLVNSGEPTPGETPSAAALVAKKSISATASDSRSWLGPGGRAEAVEMDKMLELFSLLEPSYYRSEVEREQLRRIELHEAHVRKLIHPYSIFRQRWDMWLVVIIMFNAFVISLRLGFDINDRIDWLFGVDRVIDVFFIIDVVLNFRTGIVSHTGAVILDPTKVLWTYLRGWFVVDLVSAFPYELVFLIASPSLYEQELSPELRAPGLLRLSQILRILKALKMLRLLRLSQVFTRWERAFVMKHAVATVSKFLFSIFFVSHILACVFFAVGNATLSAGDPKNWISEEGLENAGLFDKYIASVYWSLMTVTTIGYGDLASVSTAERIVSVISMVIGSSIYAYGLTTIITIAGAISRDTKQFQDKMDTLNAYMAHRKVPAILQSQIRTYLAQRYSKGKSWDEKERELLTDLSPQLRCKMAIVVNQGVVRRCRFMWNTTPKFITALVTAMVHEHYPTGEYLAIEDDPADRLFVITRGAVDVIKWGRFRVATMTSHTPDAYVGELALLDPPETCVRVVSLRCHTNCDVRTLTYEALHQVLMDFPRMRLRVISALEESIQRRRKDISDKCLKWLKQLPNAQEQFAKSSRKRRGSITKEMGGLSSRFIVPPEDMMDSLRGGDTWDTTEGDEEPTPRSTATRFPFRPDPQSKTESDQLDIGAEWVEEESTPRPGAETASETDSAPPRPSTASAPMWRTASGSGGRKRQISTLTTLGLQPPDPVPPSMGKRSFSATAGHPDVTEDGVPSYSVVRTRSHLALAPSDLSAVPQRRPLSHVREEDTPSHLTEDERESDA
jgi:CRP-like cAMP-binding protein